MIIAVIPARSGSKRLIEKNFRPFADSTLVKISISFAESLGFKVVVSTDTPEKIEKLLNKNVLSVKRSPETSSDSASAESVMKEVVEKLELDASDKILYLQPSSPFRTKYSVIRGIEASDVHTDSVIFSVTADQSEYWVGSSEDGLKRLAEYLGGGYDSRDSKTRRPLLRENGNFYIIPVGRLMEVEHLTELPFVGVTTPAEEDCDINSEFEFREAELRYRLI